VRMIIILDHVVKSGYRTGLHMCITDHWFACESRLKYFFAGFGDLK